MSALCVAVPKRKRLRGGDEESGHLVPQAKRQSRAHPLSPEPGRDACDSEVQTVLMQTVVQS